MIQRRKITRETENFTMKVILHRKELLLALKLLFLLLLVDVQGDTLNVKESFSAIKKQPPSDSLCDRSRPTRAILRSVVYFVNSLPPTNLYAVFKNETDDCLLETFWEEAIPVTAVTGIGVWESFRSSSYDDTRQYLVVGDLLWITSVISVKTRWLWMMNENTHHNFVDLIHEVTSVLPEGIQGLLIHVPSKEITFKNQLKWVVNIANMEYLGDANWRLTKAATWTSESGLFVTTSQPMWPSIPYNLKGRIVRIVCIKKPTVFFFKDNNTLAQTVGYTSDIVREVEKRLNFTSVLVPTKGFGSMLANGSWNGMVGVLSRGQADIAPLDFSPVYQRTLVIDFGLFYGTEYVVIVSKAPSILIKPFILLQIFTPLVWCCFLFLGVVSGLVLSVLYALRKKLVLREPRENHIFERYCSASLKILINQGSRCWFENPTSRIIGGGMMLTGVIFSSMYNGSVTAFLAIPFRSDPVNSIDDLAVSSIQPAVKGQGSTYSFFLKQTTGSLGEVNSRMAPFTGSQLASLQMFNDVADGKYAVLGTPSSTLGGWSSHEKQGRPCLFHTAREPVRMDFDAFAFQKNSPIRHQFDDIMRWLRNYGLITFMKGRYFSRVCNFAVGSGDQKPMTITQGQGAFYVFAVGLVFSFLVLLLEMLYKGFSNRL